MLDIDEPGFLGKLFKAGTRVAAAHEAGLCGAHAQLLDVDGEGTCVGEGAVVAVASHAVLGEFDPATGREVPVDACKVGGPVAD